MTVPNATSATVDGLAIIGLAGRFPGAAGIAEFWANLVAGKDCITHFTDGQLTAAGYDAAALRALPGYVAARGIVERPEWFDRSFFNIPLKEAEVLDPQQRVFLEVAWEALEDAGCDPSRPAGLTGVFAGMSNNTYYPFFVRQRPDLLEAVGVVSAVIANEKDFLTPRVAYKLNLRGPALNIQTACSSSLVAVATACDSLLAHQCDVALAGGVSLTFPQERGYFFQEGGMTSPDGNCRPFDARANGTVFSSGAGVVVLKRLSDALADGDQIYAVIKGHALNNDGGRKVSFAAPSVDAHAEVIALAQALAGVEPETIGYIEAHGTATPLGDPIEIAGLAQVFRAATEARQFCALGSVKGNLGHCDAASGVIGLIKTALAFRHEQLPPTIGCDTPNPALQLESSPFFLNTNLRAWPRVKDAPRRAGLSSFGVGGTNAHLVLEEAPATPSPASAADPSTQPQHVLVLSAKTATALDRRAVDLAAHLEKNPGLSLADTAFTLAAGRQVFQHRRAVVAATPAEAVAALREPAKLHRVEDRSDTPVAFLFPGQGAQYARMGAQLDASQPVFRAALDACAQALRGELGCDLRELIFSTSAEASARLTETRFTQPAIFAVSYALARLWMSQGIQPAALLGHSVGEFAAAAIAGVFSLESAARLVAARARLVQELPPGAMLAVRVNEAGARAYLTDPRLAIAAVNSPKLCVISGPFEAIEPLEAQLAADKIPARRLATSHAFHSPMVEAAIAPFAELVRATGRQAPAIPIMSSVTGAWLTDAEAVDPAYWAQHLRATVRFADAAGLLLDDPEHWGQHPRGVARETRLTLLETGPGQTLGQLVRQHGAYSPRHEIAHSIAEENEENESLAKAAARLWLSGVPVPFAPAPGVRRVSLPTYPFERQRYFADLPAGTPLPLATAATDGDAPGHAEGHFAGPVRPAALESAAESERATATMESPQAAALAELKELLAGLSDADLHNAPATTHILELGFDSLLLSQAAITLSRRFGVKITLRQLLGELGTLEALAAHVATTFKTPAPMPALPNGELPEASGRPVIHAAKARTPAILEAPAAHGPFRPLQHKLAASLTARQQRWLDDFIARYTARTAKSKAHTQTHRAHLADPRAVSGFKQAWKEMVYPIVVDRSQGGKLWDIDGNEWIDMTLSFGAAMLGHRPPFVVEAINQQLARGMEIGPSSPLAGEVAAMLCELTGLERATFCNTGSEAVTGALRVARTVTGRPRIAYFVDSYHGISDEVLGRRARDRVIPIAPGIPAEAVENVLLLDYGDPRALELIAAHAHELAAVLVEPAQSRRPDFQPRAFLHELRAVTAQHGIALIFDEIITGFRCAPGGAQEYFGVRADLATYGKVLGGGLPIGAIAGRAEFMDAFDGGAWNYGDDSHPTAGVTFFAGTFVRHPLALATARAVLGHLRERGPRLQSELAERTAVMVRDIAPALEGTPFDLPHFTSACYVRSHDFPYSGLLYALLRQRGIHIWEGRPCFLSAAHTAEDVQKIVTAFHESIAELSAGDFLPRRAPARATALAAISPSHIPLTEPQREIWFATELGAAASAAFNESCTLEFRGAFDEAALRRAIDEVVRRHDALRATFDRDGGRQVIADALTLAVPLHDLSAAPDRDAQFAARQAAEGARAFDLARGPVTALQLFKLAPEHHALIFTAHHIACDGWSCNIILRELGALYSGATLPPAKQLHDYVEWEQAQQLTPEAGAAERFWLEQFANPPPPLELPVDHPRPVQRSWEGAREVLHAPAELFAATAALSAKLGATQFALLLSAFQILLHRLSGADDFVVGIPAAGQNLADGADLVGHCANLLPLRRTIQPGAPYAEFLAGTQHGLLDAFDHQQFTFGRLLQQLSLPHDPSRMPLVSATFNLDQPLSGLRFAGLTHEVRLNPRRHYQFDLGFNLANDGAAGFRIECDYNPDLFDTATIRGWLQHYRTLLEAIVAQPAQILAGLPVLTESERNRMLVEWNATAAPVPAEAVHELIARQAARTPDRTAVECGGKTLTYAELDRAASAVAAYLQTLSVARGQLVGVCFERSVEMLATVLGVLKTGAAYVPLDPAFPAARLAMMIEDAALPVILTHAATRTLLPDFAGRCVEIEALALPSATPRPVAVEPGDRAYVLFTSGSTGRPRGVEIPHRALSNFLAAMQVQPGLVADDVLLAVTTLSFDIAALELFLPLVVGAKVVIAATETARDGHLLAAELERSRATVLQATPATWRALLLSGWRGRPGLKALAGGEAMPADLLAELLPRVGELWNMYGPTETTIWSTVERLTMAALPVSIGRPIANTTAYIVDAQLQPVPVGVAGELLLGGAGLALGYLGQPELTAERFIPHPFEHADGRRVYRTGDRARFLADGRIECLGRLDQQAKLRGFRIELGEIEICLNRDEGVAQSAVIVREDRAGDRRLVAYIVPAAARPAGPELAARLRQALQAVLPEYMVPSAFVTLPALPLTPNGKIDRRALPAPEAESATLTRYAPPENTLHTQLIEIWEQLLGRNPIGIRDHFFELGGHSLLAAQMLASIEERLGHRVAFATLFREPTVEHIATCIFASQQAAATETPMVTFHADGPERPFFFLHGDYIGGGFFSQTLAQQVGEERPFYAIHPHGLHGEPAPPTYEEMAAAHLAEIRRIQPHGPYLLGGYCNGAMIAFEMARRLKGEGESVSALILLMAYGSNASYAWLQGAARLVGGGGAAQHQRYLRWLGRMHFFNGMRRNYSAAIRDWLEQPTGEQMRRLGQKTRHILQRIGIPTGLPPTPAPPPGVPQPAVAATFARAFAAYVPRKYDGAAVLLWPIDEPAPAPGGAATGWADVCREVQVINVPGEHHSCVSRHAHLVIIGNRIREALLRAEAAPRTSAASLQLVAP